MIFIDDYDYSFASSGSSDYYDRESGVVAALANIQKDSIIFFMRELNYVALL